MIPLPSVLFQATARHEAVQDSGNMLSGMLDMLKGLPKHKRDKVGIHKKKVRGGSGQGEQ